MMFFLSVKSISQNAQASTNTIMETFNTTGNDATGNSGSITYSIGQVFYTYIGVSVYNVAQGVQQQGSEVVSGVSLSTPEISEASKTEIFIFPNPTTDYVTINMKGFEFGNVQGSYQLYDNQGRLLKQNTINQNETQVNLTDLSSSLYLLQVVDTNKISKTFKILKK
ncbi:T9SS type A sorting domain-containing protein [Flavobacterium cellulosilyticum]|uniref:T9SS type A sorting domain-containing protein n=1 Tax=Flavobacterium cellulosilyticum TaxID=2541731 RepID=A0A4R5C6D3_9FLAO|nr:T9SS type A sorting domain-containing protein [Flavobacterium cellulosilyticum]TDD93610.1 T9SS type A sorting domain-containing protein [Flavobacterium cellulosilyticum]